MFPIEKGEWKKVAPLLGLKFLVGTIHVTLAQLKEPLIVTLKDSGPEVIPVIKAWVVFPLAIFCAFGYSKLSNIFKRSTLFYTIVSLFLVIIAFYGFVLYPYADFFSPTKSADWLTAHLGKQHNHLISIYRYWMHTLFFATAELWGQVVILTLYWSFANHIFQVHEAKRTYTLFTAASDVGSIVAPMLVLYYSQKDHVHTVQTMITYSMFFGSLILFIYWWVQKYVLSDKRYYDSSKMAHSVNEKTKLSLSKSIKHILSSKYLFAIGAIVISVALTANIVEVMWRAHLKELCPDVASYQRFLAKQSLWIGVGALTIVLLFGSGALRRFGWKFTAQLSPIVMGGTSVAFFLLCIFKEHLSPFAQLFNLTSLSLVVYFGAFQAATNKIMKYSFFDPTKEMVYIPLDQESKIKGKAAIEMIGSRLGKSSSSWIQLIVIEIIGTGSILSGSSFLLPVTLAVITLWLYSTNYLNREMLAKEQQKAPEALENVTRTQGLPT